MDSTNSAVGGYEPLGLFVSMYSVMIVFRAGAILAGDRVQTPDHYQANGQPIPLAHYKIPT